MIRRVRWEGMPGVLAFELGPDDLFPFTVSLGVGPGRWLVGVDVCYYDGPHVSVGLGPIGTVAFTPKSGVGNRVAMWLYENGWGVWRCRPPPPTMAPRLTPSLVAVSSKVPGRCPAGSRSPSTGGSGCRPALRRTPMSNKGNLICSRSTRAGFRWSRWASSWSSWPAVATSTMARWCSPGHLTRPTRSGSWHGKRPPSVGLECGC